MDKKQKIQKAEQLIDDQRWLSAAALLEDVINVAPDDDVTKKLVFSLYQAKQYARAFVYFVEQPVAFTDTQSDAHLSVALLLHNQSYISARLFIAALPQSWQEDLIALVARSEQAAREKYQVTIQDRLRNFYHLGDYSLKEQQERASDAQQLPLAEYLTGAQFLLRDPFTHQLIKASLVDTLRQLGVAKEVVVRWLDGHEYTVMPVKLLALDEIPVVRQLRNELTVKLGEQNPSELQLANQELQLQLMILYPFISQKITDADAWVQCLLSKVRGEQVTVDSVICHLQERLDEVIDNLS